MQTRKIPVTVVTGFLGSGKTTLMRHILQNAKGLRIAVIVNEFGELGIDGEILKGCNIGCEDESVTDQPNLYELSNGCLCCTVQEEFYPVMEQLVERREQIDHVLIESMGLGSVINVPVLYDGNVLGTINLLAPEFHYREEHVAPIERLSPLLVPAFLAARAASRAV